MVNLKIENNQSLNRFEAAVNGRLAVLDYQIEVTQRADDAPGRGGSDASVSPRYNSPAIGRPTQPQPRTPYPGLVARPASDPIQTTRLHCGQPQTACGLTLSRNVPRLKCGS